jgi:hypothetical protein
VAATAHAWKDAAASPVTWRERLRPELLALALQPCEDEADEAYGGAAKSTARSTLDLSVVRAVHAADLIVNGALLERCNNHAWVGVWGAKGGAVAHGGARHHSRSKLHGPRSCIEDCLHQFPLCNAA